MSMFRCVFQIRWTRIKRDGSLEGDLVLLNYKSMSLHIGCAVLCRSNLDPLCFPDEMDTDEGGTDREKEKSDSERSEQRSERKRASDSDSMDVRVKTEKEETSTDGRDSTHGSYNRSFSD